MAERVVLPVVLKVLEDLWLAEDIDVVVAQDVVPGAVVERGDLGLDAVDEAERLADAGRAGGPVEGGSGFRTRDSGVLDISELGEEVLRGGGWETSCQSVAADSQCRRFGLEALEEEGQPAPVRRRCMPRPAGELTGFSRARAVTASRALGIESR